MLNLFLATALLVFSGENTVRAEDCHCDQYKDRLLIASLVETISAVGIENAMHPEGRSFDANETRIRAVKLKIQSDGLIPPECKAALISQIPEYKLDLLVRGVTFNSLGATDSSAPQALMKTYENYYSSYLNDICPQSDAKLKSDCFTKNGAVAMRAFNQKLSGSSAGVAADLYSRTGATLGARELQIMQTYQSLLVSNPKSIFKKIASRADGLTDAEFLMATQLMLVRLAKNYDTQRYASGFGQAGDHAGGVVTPAQLLAAAQHDAAIGNFATLNGNTNGVLLAGVCRDIESFAGQMLLARGFDKTVALSYATSNGDYHTTLTTQLPHHAESLTLMDYDGRVDRTGIDGAEADLQNLDAAWNYRTFRPGGSSVGDQLSMAGKVAVEAAGGSIQRLDPMARQTSSFLAANLELGEASHAQLRFIAARDYSGAQYLGLGGDYSYASESMLPGKVGFFTGTQIRNLNDNGFDNFTQNMGFLYLQAEQHAAPRISLGGNNVLTWDSMAYLYGAVSMVPPSPEFGDSSLQVQGDARFNSELRLDASSLDEQQRASYRVGIQSVPGLRDVRSASPLNVDVTFNHAYASAAGQVKVKDVLLIGSLLGVVSQLSVRAKAEAGIAYGNIAGTVFFRGSLNPEPYLIEESAIRRIGATVSVAPVKGLRINLTGEVPLIEDNPLTYSTLSAQAQTVF